MTEKQAYRILWLQRLNQAKELRKRFGPEAEFHARTAKDEAILAGCAALKQGWDSRDILIAITEQLSQNHNLMEMLMAQKNKKKKSRKKKS